MKPKPSPIEGDRQEDLFKTKLEDLVDPEHELARLAHFLDWAALESALGQGCGEEAGRLAKPTRLMAGLHYLKEAEGLSDERLVTFEQRAWNSSGASLE